MHRAKRPILAQIAHNDLLLDTGGQMAWANADPLVYPQVVEANHLFPTNPEERASQLASAMQFLWPMAPRHLRARRVQMEYSRGGTRTLLSKPPE
jgi:hypothetical protein